jgi:hypothetical protein
MNSTELRVPAGPVFRAGRLPAVVVTLLGLIALAALLWYARLEPLRAYHSYLAAYAFVLSTALGVLGFVMIAHAANTTWPVAVRRLGEAVAPALPVLLLLFAPILLGLGQLYPWMHPDRFEPHLRELLEHRRPFMNPSFFTARAALYLVIWSVVALRLRGRSLAMEHGADPERCARGLRRLSYACLPLFAITIALSGFEWLMSLSPDFASTMYGANWIAVCLFGGQACVVVLTGLAQRSRAPLPAAGPPHYSALGRLLLAMLVFLGYTVFFQFLLVWMGNRPSEAHWFDIRGQGIYRATVQFLIWGHFFVPFLLLLSYRLKRRIGLLSWVAAWCLISDYVHVHWLVTAASAKPGYSWSDLVALIAVLAPAVGVCMFYQRGLSLAPTRDPRYAAAFLYDSR